MSKFEKRDQIFIKTAFPLISDPTKLKPVTSTHSHTHIEEAQIYKSPTYINMCACVCIFFFREGWKGCDFAKFGPYNFGALNKWTKLKTILCMNFRSCQRNRYEHFFPITKLNFFLAATASPIHVISDFQYASRKKSTTLQINS